MRRRVLLGGVAAGAAGIGALGLRGREDEQQAPSTEEAVDALRRRLRDWPAERAAGIYEWALEDVDVAAEGRGWRASAVLRTRFAEEGRAVGSVVSADLVLDGDRWRVGVLERPRLPWSAGAVQRTVSEAGLVLGVTSAPVDPEEFSALQEELARELAPATSRVDALWSPSWPLGTVVVVVPDTEGAARLAGLSVPRAAVLDAVTVGLVGPLADGITSGARVVVNARRFGLLSALGRSITLTHELVHVATRSVTVRPVPRWFSEGYADLVARDGRGVPAADLAAPMLGSVAGGRVPQIPTDDDFETTNALELLQAYAAAWTLLASAARSTSVAAVTRWYRAVAAAPPDGVADGPVGLRVEAACQAALGRSLGQVRTQWLDDIAGGLQGWE